jgi:hypothetical protein
VRRRPASTGENAEIDSAFYGELPDNIKELKLQIVSDHEEAVRYALKALRSARLHAIQSLRIHFVLTGPKWRFADGTPIVARRYGQDGP